MSKTEIPADIAELARNDPSYTPPRRIPMQTLQPRLDYSAASTDNCR